MGGTASPTARSYLRSPTVTPPETPRSTSDRRSEVLRGVSGASRGRVWSRVGGTEGQRLDGLGCQAGFGWVAETRETGRGPEPGHRFRWHCQGNGLQHSLADQRRLLLRYVRPPLLWTNWRIRSVS